ncbi:MAG: RNA-binding transcriptional accessory protein, partial [Dysgonamonadaceae bacterium]|nr:RNA-binding transcriptional accessory protein [Dysgonamonadaceae bacterium]
MQTIYYQLISKALNLPEKGIQRTIELLDDGATIPFISRYRKEATGGLDEVQIGEIKSLYEKYCEMSERKATILNSIEEQEKLTPELRARIENCWNAT